MTDPDNIFSTILASTVHDMKNSLGMMLDSLNGILAENPQQSNNPKVGVVQYEASRVNSALMQLLAMYKMENNQLPFNPSYHNLEDFLEEQMLIHVPLLEAKGLNYSIDVDDELEAAFDDTLVSMVVSNIIGNAIRYTHSEILISASCTDKLCIQISDDGPGYPAIMLELVDKYIHGINQSSGSTGLGLFFARKVAEMHSHGGKKGEIALANGAPLGGGVFQIMLP